jgi:CelD/BcsL family acetyltransferase involved in cellulose biosynthesis
MQEEAERQPVTLRVQARAGVADTEALSVPAPGERVVRLIGGVAVTDYLDILAAPGDLEATWEAVFAYWADRRDDWDVLDLHSLPADSPSRAIVAHLAARYGWNSWTGIEETCPSVTLPTDWESYLAGLDKKSRHELRRKLRKVEAATEALTWQVVNSPAALPATVEQFLALHRLSNAAKATFMDRRMTGFFRDLTTTMAGPGGLEVALLCWGDRPVAAYLSFVYGGRVYLYNSGYDPQYAEWSVGLVLLARRIGEAIAAGLTCFDFLRGDERYKYDLGGMDHFVHRVLVRHNG